MNGKRSARGAAVLPAVVLAVFFLPLLPLLVGTRLLVFRDAFITHYPIARYAAQLERQGTAPFLDFAASNVEPLLANPNTVALYPTHLLYRLLPAAAAFNLHLLLHVVWAFFGAAFLARRLGAGRSGGWIAGAAYAFSGPFLSYAAAFTNAAAAAAWAPWAIAEAVALARARETAPRVRAALALGIAMALQLLAGEPAISAWTAAAVAIAFAIDLAGRARRRLSGTAGLAGAAILAAALAAPLLLATRAAIPWSFRGEHLFSRDQFNAAANVPIRLVESFLPLVFGAPRPIVSGTFWAYRPFDSMQPYLYSLNFGLVSILLAFSAVALPAFRRSRAAVTVAASTALALLLSYGFGTPLFELLWAIPALRHFRYPIKFAVPAALGIAVLAGLAARAWQEEPDAAARTRARRLAAAGAIAAGALLLAAAAAFLFFPAAIDRKVAPAFAGLRFGPDQVMPGIARIVWLDALCGGAGLVLTMLALTRFRGTARPALILAAVSLTLLPAGWPLFVSVPARPFSDPAPLSAAVAGRGRVWVADLPEFAVARLGTRHSLDRDDIGELILAGRKELWPLTGIVDGIDYAYDKDPDGSYGWLDRYDSEAIAAKPPAERARLLSAASVRFAVMREDELPLPGFVPRGKAAVAGRTIVLSEAARPVPIVRVATRVFRRNAVSSALELVASARFDPATDAVLRGPDADPPNAASDARVVGAGRIANRFRADVESAGGAVVVFAATYFRYWKASIDGAPAPVEIADASFCGVEAPRGRHRIELYYDEGPFRRGAAVGLAGAAAVILGAFAMRRSRPGRED